MLGLLCLFFTSVHTTGLGALLALSSRSWFAGYPRTGVLSLSPLEEQQLAGLIMWVPGGAVLTIVALVLAARWLHAAERRAALGALFTLAASALAITACNAERQTATQMTGGDPSRGGPAAIRKYGCYTCHTIPGVPGATGTVGPPLTGIARRMYIAGRLENSPENPRRWIEHPQAWGRPTVMPEMGVSERDGRDIAAFLYTLR